MTTITPPASPQPPPSTPSTAPVVVVQSPPPALARLAIGQLLEATVTNQSARDVFQVQTPMGLLALKSSLPLPKGGALVLQLQSQSPFVQFQINSLNGNPPPHALRTGKAATLPAQPQNGNATATGRSGKTTSVQNAPASAPKLVPGNVLQATVLRPLSVQVGGTKQMPGVPAAAGGGLAASKGGQVSQTGVATALTKSPTVQNSATTKASSALTGRTQGGSINPGGPKTAAGTISQASGYLPSGSHLSIRITGVQLSNPGAASTTPAVPGTSGGPTVPTAGTALSGTVTGSTPSGHPIIQTKAGVLSLTTETVVPRGSVITLEVVKAPMLKPEPTHSLHETLFASRKWPALEQIFQAMQEASPTTTHQLIQSIVPRPDAGLTAGIIFFLSALRGGDLRSWIGDAPMRLIERTRPNLVGRVAEDFSSLARMADEPSTGDWRVALIPINTGAEIELIRLLLRQHENEDEDEAGPSDTRFIIDVELSRFGRLQLDGLVRNNGKSLDLIVRSESPLDDKMHNDIRTIFQQAADLTGLSGGVNFQAAPADFIDIPDPSSDHELGLVV